MYRDRVASDFQPPAGTLLRVRAGAFSGYGVWSARSPIAVRMLNSAALPDARWVAARVADAVQLRRAVIGPDTTAYRLVFGEGDFLPGITVDRYGSHAVVATYADGLGQLASWVADAVFESLKLDGVLLRSKAEHGDGDRIEVVRGSPPPRDLEVLEHGARFGVDLMRGQKTGLFLDHRENRRVVATLCRGMRVLNLFAYTGGFSVHAALGGAAHVTTVDVAAPVVAAARDNFRLNGLDPEAHAFVAEDAFSWLAAARERGETWEVVVCDPPSFAKRREQLKDALKAYRRLNAAVFRLVAPGGFLATASCTAQVEPEAFRRIVAEAAARSRRRFQLVVESGAGPDHPTLAQHVEGRYLKFLLGRVSSSVTSAA